MSSSRQAPEPGQESVWDYPRPPALEGTSSRIRVFVGNLLVAETHQAKRVLETSHPPVFYIPPGDVMSEILVPSQHRSFCEWKGVASYFDLQVDDRLISRAAWSYARPTPSFADIQDHLAFYPSKVDACYVDDEKVQPQAGDFYGGWITSKVVGPFKGGPGTRGW